jgi:hypothetical protein
MWRQLTDADTNGQLPLLCIDGFAESRKEGQEVLEKYIDFFSRNPPCRIIELLSLSRQALSRFTGREQETVYVLGEAHLQPPPIRPYSSCLLNVPILHWQLPPGAETASLELFQIDHQGKARKIWEQEIDGIDKLDTGQLGLFFSEALSYQWTVCYQICGEWIFHNGLFKLLSSENADEYRCLEANLRDNTSLEKSELRDLQFGLYFDFNLYDFLLNDLFAALAETIEDADHILLLAVLREIYVKIRETFVEYKLPIEEDRVTLQIAATEEALNSLYKIQENKIKQFEDGDDITDKR